MTVRIQFQIVAHLQFNFFVLAKLAMRVAIRSQDDYSKLRDDAFILFIENTASRIHQTSTGFHQACRAIEDRGLFLVELSHAFFHFGATSLSGLRRKVPKPEHGASTSRRDRVCLLDVLSWHRVRAQSPLDAHWTNHYVPNVASILPNVFRNIEGVQTTCVTHNRTERQSFTASTGAEVSHHFTAFGAYQLCAKIWLPSSWTSIVPSLNNGRF